MIPTRWARVLSVREFGPGLQELQVRPERSTGVARALHFRSFLGPARPGDRVLLNVAAVQLRLGTGGYHFVIWREGAGEQELEQPGHIMKLRYTPWQFPVLAAEEPASPYHEALAGARGLGGRVVVALSLHSQLAPALFGFVQAVSAMARRARSVSERPRVAYMMTDGAALPLAFSQQVQQLRDRGWLDFAVTAGHAFGGDAEAVGIHSGLLTAAIAGQAEVIFAGMGPGIVGTDTKWGTTALEQAFLLDATQSLGGRPVAVVRLSGADPRSRHQGVSHHSLTVLGQAVHVHCEVALPELPVPTTSSAAPAPVTAPVATAAAAASALGQQIREQLEAADIPPRHHVVWIPGLESVLAAAQREGLEWQTMGRSAQADPLPFLAAAAAGWRAAQLWAGET